MPSFAPLVVSLFVAALFTGCLGGSDEACVPQHGTPGAGRGSEEAIGIYTAPRGPDAGEGWRILVQCNTSDAPLSAYRFEFDTAEGRTIVIGPNGTWSSPAVFYGPTNGTEPGDRIEAQVENPGNEGDPTYRIAFHDENEDQLFNAEDAIFISYDAGRVGTTDFESPLEGGAYRFTVYPVDGDQPLGTATDRSEGPI